MVRFQFTYIGVCRIALCRDHYIASWCHFPFSVFSALGADIEA